MRIQILHLAAAASIVLALGACGSADVDGPAGFESRIALGDDGQPVLPNWATAEELAMPARPDLATPRALTPPPAPGFRVPAGNSS